MTGNDSGAKVSVIITTMNSARYIRECMDSLEAQFMDRIEVIVVDRGSTDGTQGILREYADGRWRFRIMTDQMGSAGHAKNLGLDKASAPYVMFLEPEDCIMSGTLETLLRLVMEREGNDMAVAPVGYFEHDEAVRTWYMEGEPEETFERKASPDLSDHEQTYRWLAFECEAIYSTDFLREREIRYYDQPGIGRQSDAFKLLTMSDPRFSMFGGTLYLRRKEEPADPITDQRAALDICAEYRYLEDMLKKDQKTWGKARHGFWQAYYQRNMELYGKLSGELRPRLMARMHDDIQGAIRKGDFGLEYADPETRGSLELLLKAPKKFDGAWRKQDWDRQITETGRRIRWEKKKAAYEAARSARIQANNDAEFPPKAAEDKNAIDRKWLKDEMTRDMASLRLLTGLSPEEMGRILGVSVSIYKNMEAGRREITWDQYIALLFVFRYNGRTEEVVDTLGLYPERLRHRIEAKGG